MDHMKKILIASLLVLGFASLARAQAITLIVQWDANPASDNVSSYTVTLSATGATTIPPQTVTCSSTTCSASFTNISPGFIYNALVVATNEWGNSIPGTASISVTVPVQVKNIKGKKG